MDIINQIDRNKIPKHVAIIMDGNGRWAQQRDKFRTFGHENAIVSVRDTVEAAAEIGIGYLTLYAFSTENWNRPKNEIDTLMSLIVKTINSDLKTLLDNNIRLLTIGDVNSLPDDCKDELSNAKKETEHCTGLKLIIALSYSSKWEIIEAIKKIANKVKNNELDIENIDDNLLSDHLTTSKIPDPDLLIRTSGEYRISNFMLWQIAYSELYFTSTLWPDFRKKDFFEAIINYQNRERRFGMTSEQIQTPTI